MVLGTTGVLKFPKGITNLIAEKHSITKSCSRRNSTYPLKLPNNGKKSAYRFSPEIREHHYPSRFL
jgi:hypothetical protein